MLFSDYQKLALRTRNPRQSIAEDFKNALYGIFGEAGEIADLHKKVRHHGHAKDVDAFVKEVGDEMWYLGLGVYAIDGIVPADFGAIMADHADRASHLSEAKTPEEKLEQSVGNVGRAAARIFINFSDLPFDAIDRGEFLVKAEGLLWHLGGLLQVLGTTLDVAAEKNIEKLKKRYPEGFSTEASINRTV